MGVPRESRPAKCLARGAGILLAGALAITAPSVATAATVQVTTTADVVSADGVCSLREAIRATNSDSLSGASGCTAEGALGDDVVRLGAERYNLSIPPNGTPNDNHDGDLDVALSSGEDLTIDGERFLQPSSVIDANGIDRAIDHRVGGGTLTLDHVTITDGETSGLGGGITAASPLVITSSSVQGNSADSYGGGVYAFTGGATGVAIVVNSSITGNHSDADGGGILVQAGPLIIFESTFRSNSARVSGGGVGVLDGGEATIEEATIRSNSVSSPTAAVSGAGLKVSGTDSSATLFETSITQNSLDGDSHETGAGVAVFSGANLAATNTTISLNSSPGSEGFGGGGLAASINSRVQLKHVTMTTNNSASGAEGIVARNGASVSVRASILSELPIADTCVEDDGTITSQGYNIDTGTSCDLNATLDAENADAQLGDLESNGGPTRTHAIGAESDAIDREPGEVCDVPFDQRGAPRPQGVLIPRRCDAGAYELLTCFGLPVDIIGSSGADVIKPFSTILAPVDFRSTSGPDVIWAGDGADVIDGGGGEDRICGVGGGDSIWGGASAVRGQTDDSLDGGPGVDTATFPVSSAVSASLDGGLAGLASGAEVGTDVLTKTIENLTGGSAADELTGSDTASVLTGKAGDDVLVGGSGSDTLAGGAGIDTAGYADAFDGVEADLAAGTASDGNAGTDSLTSIENLIGSIFADLLEGDGNANDIRGRAGDDEIKGRAAPDHLEGQGGADTIDGGGGVDDCDGGPGQNTLTSCP